MPPNLWHHLIEGPWFLSSNAKCESYWSPSPKLLWLNGHFQLSHIFAVHFKAFEHVEPLTFIHLQVDLQGRFSRWCFHTTCSDLAIIQPGHWNIWTWDRRAENKTQTRLFESLHLTLSLLWTLWFCSRREGTEKIQVKLRRRNKLLISHFCVLTFPNKDTALWNKKKEQETDKWPREGINRYSKPHAMKNEYWLTENP